MILIRHLRALFLACWIVGPLAAEEPVKIGPKLKETQGLVEKRIDTEKDALVALYKELHQNPELSLQEVKSAARMAKELQTLGFTVTEKVGGTGVVGILKNGNGPTILVRADMDGLPVVEKTGLAYASKVMTKDRSGKEVGVMHACGHDMHMTCWVGTARVLSDLKDRWQGTLVFIAQPGEEIGVGAKAMLNDGLYKRFPKPDYCLALHCDSSLQVGQINFTEGLAMANVDTMDITVKGKGGHGAAPHTTVDPILLSAKIIMDLQTIISRERNPVDPAVITVGSIHGGTKHNIIPNEVKLQLTIRTTNDATRKHVLEAIERIVKAAAMGARAPDPEITLAAEEFTPRLVNEKNLTRKTIGLFKELLGEGNVHERPAMMGGEDFSRYGRDGEIPIFMYFLGTISEDRVREANRMGGKPLPSMHADGYFPAPEPSVRTGVKTLSMAVLNLIGK